MFIKKTHLFKEHPKKPHYTDFQEKQVYHAPAMHGQRLSFKIIEIAKKVLKPTPFSF